MRNYSEAFVGIDTSKSRNAVAIAEAGRTGEIRFLGEIPNTPGATRKLVAKLTPRYQMLHFCYEAGPTGYGLQRTIADLGQSCIGSRPRSPQSVPETTSRPIAAMQKVWQGRCALAT